MRRAAREGEGAERTWQREWGGGGQGQSGLSAWPGWACPAANLQSVEERRAPQSSGSGEHEYGKSISREEDLRVGSMWSGEISWFMGGSVAAG